MRMTAPSRTSPASRVRPIRVSTSRPMYLRSGRQRLGQLRLAHAGTVAAQWHADPADLSIQQLTQSVTSSLARCTGGRVNPDDWFPIAAKPACAMSEAARALALCAVCPVRTEC